MTEIEIRTTGELILHSEVIGQIAWNKPFVEKEVAGVYDDEEPYIGDSYLDCTECEVKQSVIDEAEDIVGRKIRHLVEDLRAEALVGGRGLIPRIDNILSALAEVEFET